MYSTVNSCHHSYRRTMNKHVCIYFQILPPRVSTTHTICSPSQTKWSDRDAFAADGDRTIVRAKGFFLFRFWGGFVGFFLVLTRDNYCRSSSFALFLQKLIGAHFEPSKLQIKAFLSVHDDGHNSGVSFLVHFGMFSLHLCELPKTQWFINFLKRQKRKRKT